MEEKRFKISDIYLKRLRSHFLLIQLTFPLVVPLTMLFDFVYYKEIKYNETTRIIFLVIIIEIIIHMRLFQKPNHSVF